MSDNPKVSIIIPVYNVEDYVGACLDSVLDQTYSNIELIIVNDASTDNSMMHVDNRLQNCRLEYHVLNNSMNMGLSRTRNKGLAVATGKYVTFIDSDDIINPCYIEHLVRTAETGKYDLVFCSIKETASISKADLGNKEYSFEDRNFTNKADVLREHGSACGYLYSRELINEKGLLFYPVYMEDVLWNAEYLIGVSSICTVNSAKYYYLKRPGSLSRPGSREIVARKTFECAKAFDDLYLSWDNKENFAELLQDRRYVRNCYWGEIKVLEYIPAECQHSHTNGRALRKMILSSNLPPKEGIQEFIMSFPLFERWIYKLLLR